MIKYFFVSVVVLCSSVGSLFAQSGWFPLSNSPRTNRGSQIHFINADIGFVSSAEGDMKTTDGGISWFQIPVKGGKIKFFNNNKIGFFSEEFWLIKRWTLV